MRRSDTPKFATAHSVPSLAARISADDLGGNFVGADSGSVRSKRTFTRHRACPGEAVKKNGAVPTDRGEDWRTRCDEPWTERYEDLRNEVLNEAAGRDGSRGRTLVVRHGLLN
jgi:hypothetical protein